MVRSYEDLAEEEKNKLADAWLKVYEGLQVYEQVTGAYDLDDIVNGDLWETIEYQKTEEEV